MKADANHQVDLFGRSLPTFGRMELQPARHDVQAHRLSVIVRIGAEFADERGVVRSGFVAALMDDVMTAAAILTLGGESEPRLASQSLNYIRGAGPGDFAAEGWVVSVGPDHCVMKAELHAQNGEITGFSQGVVVRNADGDEA